MTDKALTPKQEAFAHKYLETGNASEAYRHAYAADNMLPETVNRKAFDLMQNGKIAARLAELSAKHLKRHEITVDRVLAEYGKLAFVDIRKAFNEAGHLKPIHDLDDDTAAAIAGIDLVENQSGAEISDEGIRVVESYTKKIRLSDKRAALDSLAKHLGMFVARSETTITFDGLTDDQLDTQLDRLAAQAGVRLAPGGEGPA